MAMRAAASLVAAAAISNIPAAAAAALSVPAEDYAADDPVAAWLRTACNSNMDWGPIPPNPSFEPQQVLVFMRHGARTPCNGGNRPGIDPKKQCWPGDDIEFTTCSARQTWTQFPAKDETPTHRLELNLVKVSSSSSSNSLLNSIALLQALLLRCLSAFWIWGLYVG